MERLSEYKISKLVKNNFKTIHFPAFQDQHENKACIYRKSLFRKQVLSHSEADGWSSCSLDGYKNWSQYVENKGARGLLRHFDNQTKMSTIGLGNMGWLVVVNQMSNILIMVAYWHIHYWKTQLQDVKLLIEVNAVFINKAIVAANPNYKRAVLGPLL